MLTELDLGNFISHTNTKLVFNKGITVFVGPNGAGKSSVIDAITFALFGKHKRKSNKGLIRRGSSQAYTCVDFSILNRMYRAVRKIDLKGVLSAQFYEIIDGNLLLLAEGERKQFDESMTKQVESVIGMDFDKLKVASIVQQGELNSIIDAEPRKFKELVNAIIGIDKLDTAFAMMNEIIENFRNSIRKDLSYDDTNIENLRSSLSLAEKEIKDTQPKLEEIILKKYKHEEEINQLQNKINVNSTKELKINDLEKRKSEFIIYVKNAISSRKKEISENERKLLECEECFRHISSKEDTERQIMEVKNELEFITNEIRDYVEKIGNLSGQEEIVDKIKIKNGKCPVCDSQVDHLNPLFQKEHLKNEIVKMRSKVNFLKEREKEFNTQKHILEQKHEIILRAETALLTYDIKTPHDLTQLKENTCVLKDSIKKVPADLNSYGNMMQLFPLDSVSENMLKTISILEDETRGFDLNEFENLKSTLEQKHRSLSNMIQEIGAIKQKMETAKDQQKKASEILDKLEPVKKYVLLLDKIKNEVYNRDGPVATSLRSWALNLISQKASEYLAAFNVKIQRVSLEEKARDVGVSCYSGNTVLDLESLSGGEKVSVALALRLGMAHILGASNLNFIILDEPTTHLDEERRKSLVSVLSQAFEANLGSISQFIIITHDSEIFENSNVDMIYNFESTAEGTKVTPL